MGLFSYLRRYPTMKNRGNHIVLMFDDFLVQVLVTRKDYWNYVCICLYSDPTLFDLLLGRTTQEVLAENIQLPVTNISGFLP